MKKYSMLAGRMILLSVFFFGAFDIASGQTKPAKLPKAEYKVRVDKDVMIPMRDGVKMATDIFYPIGLDKAPVILVRTPYGKNVRLMGGRNNFAKVMAGQGYIVINQDVRGRYNSEGDFYPFVRDGADGQDMIAWVKGQSWYGGKLGTYGASYLGTTQWYESPGQPISAMHLTVTSPDMKEVLYTNGELHLMTVYFWSIITGEHKNNFKAAASILRINRAVKTLPLSKADDKAGWDVKYFNEALDAVKIMDIYKGVDFDKKYQEVSAPAVFVVGWYDMFEGPQLDDFNRLITEGKADAKKSVLIVGPWGHGPNGDGTVSYGDKAGQGDAVGPEHYLAWYDFWLKGKSNGVDKWPKVKIFVMGDNTWRNENEWPLARTQYKNIYLHSGGKANTAKGDGRLSWDAASSSESADKFDYDPQKPVPTKGGNSLGLNLGAYNQARIEMRKDVLCYTSDTLEKDLEVTGPVRAVLYAASDAKDTDFTIKLVDVYPDGRAVNIQDGVVRAMYRANDPLHPTPLVPGAAEKYEIDLWATSNVFKAGHKIRVEVSSSNFPRFNRNLNTGEPVPDAVRSVVARQTIYHDAEHPSHVVLPVIPR